MKLNPHDELTFLVYRLAKLLTTLAETDTLQGEHKIACSVRQGEGMRTIVAYIDGNDFHMTTVEGNQTGLNMGVTEVNQ